MQTLSLPVRPGERPVTGPSVPHVQLTQTGPQDLREELRAWMTTRLPGTVSGQSEISDQAKMRAWMAKMRPDAEIGDDVPQEEAWAVFLPDDVAPAQGAVLMPPRLTAEFAHLHPDGSLHLAMSPEDQRQLVETGWGEKHPLHSADVNVVMLYSPRTESELDIARTVIGAAYRYATGVELATDSVAGPVNAER